VARGATVIVRGMTRGMSKSCAIYLRAADASIFHVEQAPSCNWAEVSLRALSSVDAVLPAVRVGALYDCVPNTIDRRQLRLRVRLHRRRCLLA
jgi:hypothetical protein